MNLAVALVAAALVLAAVAVLVWGRPACSCKKLRVGPTNVGRGVFAQRDFAEGEVVETCPLLVMPTDQWGDATADYVFEHDDKNKALALGLCSMYNHSKKPNLTYEIGEPANTMVTRAARDIKAGEELRISYGANWFKERDMQEK